MSVNTLVHEELKPLSVLAGEQVRRAGLELLVTDAQVVAATNTDDLAANVAAAKVHEEYAIEKLNVARGLSVGKAIGDFTDARVQAATGVTDLVNDTYAGQDTDAGHTGPNVVS